MHRSQLLHIAIAFAVFGLLLWQIDLESTVGAIEDVSLARGAIVVGLNLPLLFVFWLRSKLLLDKLGYAAPTQTVVAIAIVGNIAGSLTPAASGEALRGMALRRHLGVPLENAAALVIYERGLSVYLLGLATMLVGAFLLLPAPFWPLVIVVASALLFLPLFLTRLSRFLPEGGGSDANRLTTLLSYLRSVVIQVQSLLSDIPLMAAWSLLTVCSFLVASLQVWLLCRGLSGGISIEEAWLAFGASQLAGIASLLPFGIGVGDGSLAAILNRAGLTLAEGAGVAILFRATVTLPLILAALLAYLYLARRPLLEPGEAQIRSR